MALNLPEIGQLAIRNLKNAGEIVRNLWRLHFDPNPQDVLTEIYDENGNLRQVRIPNVAKWRDVIWKDAQSAMSKVFYVDQVNGNDTTGDGSSANPFKEIDKAILSVPDGGTVDIYIKGNYTLRNNVPVRNKRVRIILEPGAVFKTTWYQDVDNNFNWLNGFSIIGFVAIEFFLGSGAKIVLDDEGFSTNVNIGTSSYNQFIKKSFSCVGYVFVSGAPGYTVKPSIEIAGVNSAPSFMSHGNAHSSEALVLHLWDVNIVKKGNGWLTTGDGVFALKANQVGVKDGAGNVLAWSSIIAGIIRDANGTPRNVVSNLIL